MQISKKHDIVEKKEEKNQEFLGFKIISGGFSEKLKLGGKLYAVIVNDPDPGTEKEKLITQTQEMAVIEINLRKLYMKNKISEESG